MSRRKQENPQPRKRLVNGGTESLTTRKFFNDKAEASAKASQHGFVYADTELLQDTLTCGSCQKVFALSEIVKFIQHKVHSCNKENNFILLEDGEDSEDGAALVAPRAPPISAPICNRKGFHLLQHRNNKTPAALSSPESPRYNLSAERRTSESGFFERKDFDESERRKAVPVIKEEVKDPALRCSPKVTVNAYTNTIITEPSTYTCSTCKQTFTSAWVLVQHAQHMHGMKIYLVTPYHGSRTSTSSAVLPPSGPPPSLINTTLPLPPVLPPCSMNGPTHHHHGVLPQQSLSLENHPALQLLRMPLGERQFGPSPLNPPSIFSRSSSQDFRVDMLATSSATSGGNTNTSDGNHFHRLNHPHPPLPPHSFIDRGPLGLETRPRPPMSLGFEPQMDFYSQRLRQLAGATSPTTAISASPRKLTPPFTHPPMSSSSQPSTPTSTPQPALNLHNSSGGNTISHNNNPAHRGSSASSTSSKGGGVTDAADGSPKLLKSWTCEFCGRAFRFQSNLIVHRRSHTGEKPYKCPICRHSCSQASKLKRHMKTHQSNNGKSVAGSENNSIESPRSTPDSTSETGKDLSNKERRPSIDEDDDASDGQAADNEEEEEDLDEEDEEDDELDDEEDLDDSMMAEDLSTRGPNSSTPVPRSSPSSDQNKTSKNISDDIITNNDNNSSNTISISNGENGTEKDDKDSPKPETRHSLLSEVMDKIGLSNIQQYNEAYKKALEESSLKNSTKETESGPKDSPITENGPESLKSKEDGNNNKNGHGNNNNKALVLHQHAMEFGHGFFGAFDYNHHHHHNNFEANKRLKLDISEHLRNNKDRDSLYAGLWLPSVHGSPGLNARDVYDMTDFSRHNKSSSSESALKSVTPTNMCSRSMSPRPGTSGTPMSGLKSNNISKEQRRNDTCEYCGKVFKNCSNLTVHRRSHTGEKPYKCELCSYACAQSSKLTRHMKTHGRLGKDVYRCRFCDMPFSVPSTLEKHMRKCVVNQNAGAFMDRDSDSKDLT